MTSIDWLNGAAVAAFAVVTVLALVRLGRHPGRALDRFLDDGFHAVMGVAMTAMAWPRGAGPAGAWTAVIGMVVVWPLLVFALAGRRRPGGCDPSGADGTGRVARLGRTGYWVASGLLMIVAVGAGHGHGSVHAGPGDAAESGGATGWPIWPLFGVGFLLYAMVVLIGSRGRPLSERACAVVMAVGMAVMAFSI